MPIHATIFGLSGLKLTDSERAFFRDVNPWAFILFARNINTPTQVSALTQSLKECVGRDALIKRRAEGLRKKLVSLQVFADYAPAYGGASLQQGERVVGTITSGEWGHRVAMNLAYAFVDPEFAGVGTELDLDLLGDMVKIRVIAPSPYDPEFAKLRS